MDVFKDKERFKNHIFTSIFSLLIFFICVFFIETIIFGDPIIVAICLLIFSAGCLIYAIIFYILAIKNVNFKEWLK